MARRGVLTIAAGLLGLAMIAGRAHAEPYGPFNRQDDYRIAESEHFRFYFTPENQRTTAELLRLAEPTFERLNRYYGYHPAGKIKIVVVGYTDYSNGFADYSRDQITIFATPPDFHSRSRVPWLEGVFTHELSHILSLNTATHFWSHAPLVLSTGVARSTNWQALVRLPINGLNLPHWLSEGVAQFDTYRLGRDDYDENRRAFQRAAVEDQLLLPLDKLAFFGGEQWYNSGFAFLIFLEDKFGEGTVHRLFRRASDSYDLYVDQLFPRVLGVSLSDLEREFRQIAWQRFAEHRARASAGAYDGHELAIEGQEQPYQMLSAAQKEYLREGYQAMALRFLSGELFFRKGDTIFHAAFAPDGRSLSKPKALAAGGVVAPNSADSFFVLQAEGQSSSLLPYVYHPKFESQSLSVVTKAGDRRVLLKESRISDMDVCSARSELAAVYNDGDGSLRLALFGLEHAGTHEVKLQGGGPRFPLPAQAFDEVRGPRYSPDCRRLYFSRRIGRDHDLFALDLASGQVQTVSAESAFELYPEPTRDGVYYVSSRSGTMEVYYRPYDGSPARRVTQAVTAHHHPVDTPAGLMFARLYGTGFHMQIQPHDRLANEPVGLTTDKPMPPARDELAAPRDTRSYNAFAPQNLLAPSVVPLLDVEYDARRPDGGQVAGQVGLELWFQDALSKHSLLVRGFLGNLNSVVLDYSNAMLPVTLRARAGLTQSRDLYVYHNPPSSYEHVTDTRWGFLYGGASLRLSLFHTLTASAETTRDIGTTSDARERRFDFAAPRYGRDMFGLRYDFLGIDRSTPNFRERDINKRGYRELGVGAYFAQERVDPWLEQFDPSLRGGVSPYARIDLNYSEYLALPTLNHGFFDHSLQIDLQFGYISRDIAFLQFIGGGQLYSQSAPQYNVSVGFGGYRFYSIRGETLLNLAVTYRMPIARRLAWNLGPLFIEDIYAQVFSSVGNIWSFDPDGHRQIPLVDAAANGRRLLCDVGLDVRIGNFWQEAETNIGTTLRAVYRAVPFTRCPDTPASPDCLAIDGKPGFMFYAIVGGGF